MEVDRRLIVASGHYFDIALIWVRTFVAAYCAVHGGLLGVGYCVAELIAVLGGMRHVLARVQVDRRPVGLLVPMLYLVGAFVAPTGEPAGVWVPAMFAVLAVQVWVRLCLGASLSVGVPGWVRLCDAGPYRVIRHPMMLCSLLVRAVFVAANPSAWNAAAAAAFVLAVVVEVLVEESFLRGRPEWCEYAGRVRWRMVPGVF